MENVDSPAVIAARWDRTIQEIITNNLRDGWADEAAIHADLDNLGTRRPAQDEHLRRMERQGKIVIDDDRIRNA